MKKYILNISILFTIILSSCIVEHDNEPPCGDKQGTVDDRCARVALRNDGYNSDGSTYETIKLVFYPDSSSAVNLNFTDDDSLIEEGVYTTNTSLGFSGRESQKSLVVTITEVVRTDSERTISGYFEFSGTYAANFQSYGITKEGTFNNVPF